MARKQCAKCPWRKDVNPFDIPDGYCPMKHANLKETIADPEVIRISGDLRIMACHESKVGRESPCVGWLAHQLGPGNNLLLRLRAIGDPSLADLVLVGDQHETFEDTLPREE